ncbi:hypothetical protein [Chitinophaga sp. 22620]|uniref:hypothetical protein n=1 Tax=Chitinophaga sp. 22620 TaxID=3453952 RepID=UPI003F86C6C1
MTHKTSPLQQLLLPRRKTAGIQLPHYLRCMAIGIVLLSGCAKIDFKTVKEPAYLRVFNNLRFKVTVQNQDQALSTLTMLINPVYGADGLPVSAATLGDFLVTRPAYAPPYPSHIGNSLEKYNPEFPGKERVIAGPILNGFDLSSWAQVPSGKMRIAFYARPKSEVPFFDLDPRYRAKPLIDTTLDLLAGEVYTLHALEKDFNTKETGVLLRREVFHKLSLADSLVYVNFYNMSAKGFWQADRSRKPEDVNTLVKNGLFWEDGLSQGVVDEMNVYCSVYDERTQPPAPIPSFTKVFLTHLVRNTESAAAAPYSFLPLLTGSMANTARSPFFQLFTLLAPGYDIRDDDLAGGVESSHQYTFFTCHLNGNGETNPGGNQNWGAMLPNLIVTTHSGVYNPRSFGTVNTIEIVNGSVHLITVQRVYDPPVYE